MPKPCNYEGCKFPRFSKGFCKRHQPKKPFVYKENKKPSNLRQPVQKALQITSVFRGVRKRIRKITAKQAIKNKEKAKLTQEDFLFYLGIWEQRPHICYNCECYLGEEPLSLFFDHILEKGLARYAHLRHVEDNICLLCWQCHTNKSMIKKLIILREETIKKLMMTKEEYVEAIKKVEQECEKAKKILVRS